MRAGVAIEEDDSGLPVARCYIRDPFGNRIELVDERDAGFSAALTRQPGAPVARHDGPRQPVGLERVGVGRQDAARVAGLDRVEERGRLPLVGVGPVRDGADRRPVVVADVPVALAALRSLGERRDEPVRDELDLDDRRRQAARVRERPDRAAVEAEDRRGAVGDVGPAAARAGCRVVEAAPTTVASPIEQSREVVQVGRLLDDLPAALLGPAPPGRTRRRIEPAGDDELGAAPSSQSRTSVRMSRARRW